MPWVFALAFLVLGGAVAFLWQYPAGKTVGPSPESQRLDALAQQVQQLQAETKQLAARPLAEPQALAAIQAQLASLASRRPAAPDLSGVEGRIAALEQRKPPAPADLGPVEQRLASVEQQLTALGQVGSQTTGLAQHTDQLDHDQQALAEQVRTLSAGAKNADSGLGDRIDANGRAIDALRAELGKIGSGLTQAARAARIETAITALQAGKPLGDIPGAPPEVARFASSPPPTPAQLRRSFPPVADAALATSRPATDNQRFVDRVWNRAQNLVTIRQGDHVLVGDPAAGIVASARDAVDAGDVAGAVDALSKLTGPSAAAVADWLASARALLAARAGLLGMVGQDKAGQG